MEYYGCASTSLLDGEFVVDPDPSDAATFCKFYPN